VAEEQCGQSRSSIEPGAVRRHCLFMVHRRAARSSGELEDRFFATVFFGSGLLFLAMLFASGAVAGGIITVYTARPEGLLESATFTFARAVTYEIMNLYAVKMAAVFMVSTSTLALRTGFTQRWIAFLGFAFALLLLFSGRYINWILLLFPLWVLLISVDILIDNLLKTSQPATTEQGQRNS
jgi:hypothetical protein